MFVCYQWTHQTVPTLRFFLAKVTPLVSCFLKWNLEWNIPFLPSFFSFSLIIAIEWCIFIEKNEKKPDCDTQFVFPCHEPLFDRIYFVRTFFARFGRKMGMFLYASLHLYKSVFPYICPSKCRMGFQKNRRKRWFKPGKPLRLCLDPFRTHRIARSNSLGCHRTWNCKQKSPSMDRIYIVRRVHCTCDDFHDPSCTGMLWNLFMIQ